LAPAGAKKIEDVVLPMFKTQQVQADIAQIGTIAATSFQFDNNLSAFCNHGLLNGFYKMANGSAIGATLISINSDIIRQGAKRPVCYSDAQDLCVSTQLTDGTYSCVDKNSTVGKTQCTSAKTVCK
jgi:hypothetical protein